MKEHQFFWTLPRLLSFVLLLQSTFEDEDEYGATLECF